MGDVAARVGVSRQLVSLVFRNMPGASDATRARVLEVAEELGYRPDTAAQVLRRARSGHVGVLFTLRHPHDASIVEAIYPAAERVGYDIALGASGPGRDERKAVESLLAYRIEALIVIGPYVTPDKLATLARQIPVVEISRPSDVSGVDSVRTDDHLGVHLAVEHLHALGHRAIVHVDGGDMPGAEDRRSGYRTAMQTLGLDSDIRVVPAGYTEEAGARAARQLMTDGTLPTAIVAGNDRCAIGLIGTFTRRGINVPGDISIVGYDDSQPAGLSYVDLTSVRQDATQLAEAAITAVSERLDQGRDTSTDIVLEPRLVVRGTTAAPRL
ncbi:LacI family DNA-binding transcriptional regulator [Rhodococcus sp. T2V]|uniref:LacI family DNA-binding transcriptional regulator n=1 Tax=Rhodococcus sp. T2V TaxID=3034164 RepID=UPI0023E0F01D|nr:LacI family DNA-binding transcriptional regulator [Rhodococcus sp. T2V]MDF3307197.1 LacI family DNA-binding transcriptional regulator [Rhodococcus sp. T2V]